MSPTISIPEIIIYTIMIGGLVATGIILSIRRTKLKSNNLEFLIAFSFGAAATAFFFAVYTSNLIVNIGFCIFTFLPGYFLLVFTNRTFYTEKKSPFLTLFIIILVVLVINIAQEILIPHAGEDTMEPFTFLWVMGLFRNLLFAITLSIPGYWFGYLAIKQYRGIKHQNIEPWIKMRFLISGICAILFGSIGWQSYMITISTIPALDPTAIFRVLSLLVSALILITFSIGNFIVWVMPEKIKLFFNRKYKTTGEEDLSEDEIMKRMEGE